MERHDEWRERKRKHREEYHGKRRQRNATEDPSCVDCYRLREQYKTTELKEFWKWYTKLVPAETYNRNTLRGLDNLMIENKEELVNWNFNEENEASF